MIAAVKYLYEKQERVHCRCGPLGVKVVHVSIESPSYRLREVVKGDIPFCWTETKCVYCESVMM